MTAARPNPRPATAFDLGRLDRPCLAHFRRAAAPLAGFADWPGIEDYERLFAGRTRPRSASGAEIRFELEVVHRRRTKGKAIRREDLYDGRIHELGLVPTRAGSWHDLFNALAWVTFPAVKRALNARQHASLARTLAGGPTALPGARTREQDTMAMIDEGGILVIADDPEVEAEVAAGDGAAIAARSAAGRAFAVIYGHALAEHLVLGSPALVRGYAVFAPAPGPLPTDADELVSLADGAAAALLADPTRFVAPGGRKGLALSPPLFV